MRAAGLVLCILGVLLIQWQAGAYRGDLGVTDDSGAHFVTGVMVRQYALALLNFDFQHPLRFAEDYYTHYPKLGIGQWPPGFYLIEGAWMLLFGTSRSAVMVLLGLSMAAALYMVYELAARLAGPWLGLGTAALLLSMGSFHRFCYQVQPDLILAGVAMAAALAFGRYAAEPGWGAAGAWTLLAVLAILIKGNALALAFLPPIYVGISRRFDLLRRVDFWGAAAVVAAICGPWYWFTRDIWARVNTKAGTAAFGLYADVVLGGLSHLGLPLVAAALAGAVAAGGRDDGSARRRLANAMAALLLAWIAFHSLSPVGAGPRKHLLTLMLLILFAVICVDVLARWAARWKVPRWAAAFVLFVGLAWATDLQRFHLLPKPVGMREAAVQIAGDPLLRGAAVLVSSEGAGEGSLIAELASLEPEPQRYVLRASQLLARSDWYDRRYELKTPSTGAVARLLDSLPVAVVVIDHRRGRGRPPHHSLLAQTVQKSSAWELAGAYPQHASRSDILVDLYRRRGEIRPLTKPPRVYSGTLGREIGGF